MEALHKLPCAISLFGITIMKIHFILRYLSISFQKTGYSEGLGVCCCKVPLKTPSVLMF
jgi:hypothetical protein